MVCYKIVFNFGLAAGASYGTFKFSMVVLNVATRLMLMVSKRRTVCIIRIISVIVFFGVNVAIIAVQATSLHVFFRGGTLVTILQIFLVLVSAIVFLFVRPWKDLIVCRRNLHRKALKRYNTFPIDSP